MGAGCGQGGRREGGYVVVTGWNAASPQYFPTIPEISHTFPHFSTLPHHT